MILAKFQIEDKEYCYIYCNNRYGWDQYYKDTFSPLTQDINLLILSICNGSYEEKKQQARNLAIDYSNNFSSLSWSYSELAEICNFFEKVGKRYGLLKEFHENGIC